MAVLNSCLCCSLLLGTIISGVYATVSIQDLILLSEIIVVRDRGKIFVIFRYVIQVKLLVQFI